MRHCARWAQNIYVCNYIYINMTNLKIGLMCLQLATECRKHFWVWGSALKGVNNPQRCRACALQAQALETKTRDSFPSPFQNL